MGLCARAPYGRARSATKNNVVPEQYHPRPSIFNNEQHAIVKEEIDKLVSKGVIVPMPRETGEFMSTHRTILNLKELNEFVAYHHFKMDTLAAAISMMKPGCFMALVDLKDAYYTIPIHPSHQKYLKFWFDGFFLPVYLSP